MPFAEALATRWTMWGYLDLAIPSLVSLVSFAAYTAVSKELSHLRSAVPYTGSEDAHLLDKQYVYVEGTVGLSGQGGIRVGDIEGVLYQRRLIRHYSAFSQAWEDWRHQTQPVGTIFKSVPFHILRNNKPVALVPKIHDLPEGLDLTVATTEFTPTNLNLGQQALEYLSGEKNVGLETVEKILPVGAPVTIIGELHLTTPPSIIDPENSKLPYIITCTSFSKYLRSRSTEQKICWALCCISLSICVLAAGRRACLWYMGWRSRKRESKRLRQIRKKREKDQEKRELEAILRPNKNQSARSPEHYVLIFVLLAVVTFTVYIVLTLNATPKERYLDHRPSKVPSEGSRPSALLNPCNTSNHRNLPLRTFAENRTPLCNWKISEEKRSSVLIGVMTMAGRVSKRAAIRQTYARDFNGNARVVFVIGKNGNTKDDRVLEEEANRQVWQQRQQTGIDQ
ncbi:hypothetical protein SpCBS45565_g07123 [Spizellomyces sp. 'palustris']|nr:hypothetical protein SpCBS45565_g07123 [Spizellomyces sp. 'palustris']